MLNAPFADTPLRLTYGGAKNQKAIFPPNQGQAIARCLAAGCRPLISNVSNISGGFIFDRLGEPKGLDM
jgi:hypothetical protein